MKKIVRNCMKIAAAAMLLTGTANAAMFDEGMTDLSNVFLPVGSNLNVFTTDVGSNSISGNLSGNCDATGDCSGDEQDFFDITVGAGQEITSIFLQSEGGGSAPAILLPFFGDGIFAEVLPVNDSTTVFTSMGPDTYAFGVLMQASGMGSAEAFWNVNITTALSQASPVPLPAALPMFVAAIAGAGALRRRKKAA